MMVRKSHVCVLWFQLYGVQIAEIVFFFKKKKNVYICIEYVMTFLCYVFFYYYDSTITVFA